MSLCALTVIQIKAADVYKRIRAKPRSQSAIKRSTEPTQAPVSTGIDRSPNIRKILQDDPDVIKRAVMEYKKSLQAQKRKSL